MIVTCPFAQFDGTRFHDPEYVRAYRKRLLEYVRDGTRGIGIRLHGNIENVQVGFLDNQWIYLTYSIGLIDVSSTVFVNNDDIVEQSIILTSRSSAILSIDYNLSLKMSLNRASYGQLTEGGPIPIPGLKNHFDISQSGDSWSIVNENLDAIVQGGLYCDNKSIFLGSQMSEEVYLDAPVDKSFHGSVELLPQSRHELRSTFSIRPMTISNSGKSSRLLKSTAHQISSKGQWKMEKNERGLIIQRNLEYILGNCTFPIGDEAVCFITDHVALPLGWNRDN